MIAAVCGGLLVSESSCNSVSRKSTVASKKSQFGIMCFAGLAYWLCPSFPS